jgi:hypothetical protein
MIALLPRVVDSLLERDAACADAKAPIRVTRRRIQGHDVYFAINDSDTAWEGEIHFCGQGVSEQWDPATGTMTRLTKGRQVPIQMAAYGAMFFRTATANAAKRLPGDPHAALSMTCTPLPATPTPGVSRGQFVESKLSGDDNSGWHAEATLTKGQVDTFLFLNFAYATPLDLTTCEGLAIDASVPPGQSTPAELLVFLQLASGDRFLGGTGHYLNSPGSHRLYVMFSQFRPFGTTAGQLDLSQVASVSVGWGGYLGMDGEQIRFTAKPPQRFVCGR